MRYLALTTLLLFVISANGTANEAIESSETARVVDFKGLLDLLNRDGVTHQTDEKNKAVTIPTEKGTIDGIMVIRWDAEHSIVHFIQPMMMEIPMDKVKKVETALLRLNHAMSYPGLGINHDSRHPYFRMSVPLMDDQGLSVSDVRAYFSNTLAKAAKWRPTLQRVLQGATKANKVVESFNASQFPTGSLSTEVIGSTWTMNFDGKESLTLKRDGKEVVQSTYEVRGKLIRFNDRGGPMAVDTPGVYSWKQDGNQIRFVSVEEKSAGRKAVLSNAPWVIDLAQTSEPWQKD